MPLEICGDELTANMTSEPLPPRNTQEPRTIWQGQLSPSPCNEHSSSMPAAFPPASRQLMHIPASVCLRDPSVKAVLSCGSQRTLCSLSRAPQGARPQLGVSKQCLTPDSISTRPRNLTQRSKGLHPQTTTGEQQRGQLPGTLHCRSSTAAEKEDKFQRGFQRSIKACAFQFQV